MTTREQTVQLLDNLTSEGAPPAEQRHEMPVNAASVAGIRRAGYSLMVATSDTHRVNQPTIAFAEQPTLAIGPNDLARELFRQSATSSTFRRPVAAGSTSVWDGPTVRQAPPQSRARAFFVCAVCLLLGVLSGYLVREGRAYASGLETRGVSARAPMLLGNSESRAARVAISTHASAYGALRVKDASVAALRASARPARLERASRPARPSIAKPAVRAEADALFLDFEPTFRVER